MREVSADMIAPPPAAAGLEVRSEEYSAPSRKSPHLFTPGPAAQSGPTDRLPRRIRRLLNDAGHPSSASIPRAHSAVRVWTAWIHLGCSRARPAAEM